MVSAEALGFKEKSQGNRMWPAYQRGMGFQPMNHRQDADATSVRNAHMQLSWEKSDRVDPEGFNSYNR